MNIYRIDYTTQAGNAMYEYHNATTTDKAVASFLAHKATANTRMFAVDSNKPVTATFIHPVIPVTPWVTV
jgi:hypothetical protein